MSIKGINAIRSAFHATHGYLPTQLVFRRDMFMPVSTNIDWDAIKESKQKAIHKSNEHKNSLQINHAYLQCRRLDSNNYSLKNNLQLVDLLFWTVQSCEVK